MNLADAIRENGFDDEREFHKLVASVDLTNNTRYQAFMTWRECDGTKTGLLKVLGREPEPALAPTPDPVFKAGQRWLFPTAPESLWAGATIEVEVINPNPVFDRPGYENVIRVRDDEGQDIHVRRDQLRAP